LAELKIGRGTGFLHWQAAKRLPGTVEIAGFDEDADGNAFFEGIIARQKSIWSRNTCVSA
jgi:hypothetical protein